MNKLRDLFTSKGLIEKKAGVWVNKKGILNVGESSPGTLRHFADLTARIGVELSGLQSPITGDRAESAITLILDDGISDGYKFEFKNEGLFVLASSHAEMGEAIKDLVTHVDTENAITIEQGDVDGSVETEKYDAYNNISPRLNTNEKIKIIWSDLWEKNPESSLFLFARIALDNFRAEYPFVLDKEDEGKDYRYLRPKEAEDHINAKIGFAWNTVGSLDAYTDINKEMPDYIDIPFGQGINTDEIITGYCNYLQELKDLVSEGWLTDLEDIVSGRNDAGQMAAAMSKYNKELNDGYSLLTKGNSRAIVNRESWDGYFASNTKEAKHWDYHEEWEGKVFLDEFNNNVVPNIKRNEVIDVFGMLSEDLDVREMLEKKIEKSITIAGGVPGEIKIYRAFKSGASWIEEKIIPKLKTLSNVDRIMIEFKYFVNEQGDDAFEDESVPNYGVHEDKPNKWFDIPTRWLQELFPVDEAIEKELEISKDKVEFVRADNVAWTYRVTAMDGEKAVWRDVFTTHCIKKHYIERYPQIGWTHVSTGWLRASSEDGVIYETRIETDMEKMWTHLENEVIPDIESYCLEKYGGKSQLLDAQPLFSRLNIDIEVSEMDIDIGIRNERISMLESMQEDIYFYILDWFKTYGERECGAALDNIGLVVPKPENRKGSPSRMKITLFEEISDSPGLIKDPLDQPISMGELENRVCLGGISFLDDGKPELLLDVICPNQNDDLNELNSRLQAICTLVDDGAVQYPTGRDIKVTVNGAVSIDIPKYVRNAPTITDEERQYIIDYKVVNYQTYMKLLDYYGQDERLRIIPVGTTYQGHKIFGIELVSKIDGVCFSRYKLMTNRITAIFNARHHGNESAGLNSGFMLIDRLLTEPSLKDLLDGLNIITIPYENIDGGEMHCEIHQEHPHWLAHIARYNSVGFEFRKDYGNPDTKYGEARPLRELWEKWLPDIITDNHGFEGHEMCQPFSGYISPWYKSFWIPRALYYGYIWLDSRVPHLKRFGKFVREQVTEAINSDEEIRAWNEVCSDRFDKYARDWFPDLFVSTKHNDVVFYWMDTALHPRANNFAISNPEITVIDWTTEVADETVTGENFYLNARAHLISDLALLDVIARCKVEYDEYNKDGAFIKIRKKPLTI